VLNKFFIQQVEKKKKDLRCRRCITKLMEHLAQENKNIETMYGLFLRLSIDLDMQRKRFPEELHCHYILRELEVFSQKQL
jgi:hypothetical protein